MIFFTADLHLYHDNIIRDDFGPHKRTQFVSTQEMNDYIISNWKRKVSNGDTVYVLGDFALGNIKTATETISGLPGKKILLMGNHDVPKIKVGQCSRTAPQDLNYLKYDSSLFEIVYPASQTVDFRYGEYTLLMNHYPPHLHFESLLPHHIFLHAHSHSKKEYNMANMSLHIPVYDVGVDSNDFSPISIEELFETMRLWASKDTIRCNVCGAVMKERSGPYGRFLGCSNYPRCKRIYNGAKIDN